MRKAGLFTKSEVVEALRLQKGMKSLNAYAEEIGITPQLLCDVLAGRRGLPIQVLDFMGIEDDGKRYRRKARGVK